MKGQIVKAKLIRDMEPCPTPGVTPREWIVEKDGRLICPAGLVIEHPQAFWQVLQGNAEPADDECRARVARLRTPSQLRVARAAYDELLASGSLAGDDTVEDDDNEGILEEGDDE